MIWSKFGGEFVDVIEWTDDSKDTLVYRFERYGNEIKYGAKLTVRPGQIAVFVNEGKLADTFSPGGKGGSKFVRSCHIGSDFHGASVGCLPR